ncbi:hypothetical protein [Microvirga pakistanensis]|uniref:hypothetical protein n=1 Tax=Microvirga pakistanensis TaxID=1682650 RepID=UPI001068FF89|nr:hypothetical protein [Microvirga pakistanensis]
MGNDLMQSAAVVVDRLHQSSDTPFSSTRDNVTPEFVFGIIRETLPSAIDGFAEHIPEEPNSAPLR